MARSHLTAAYRVRKLQDILSKTIEDTSGEPDVDGMDLQDYKFLPGDIVTLLSRKRDEAEQWKVVSVLDELLSLQCVTASSESQVGEARWQACGTDKLLLADVHRQLSRTRLRQEVLDSRAAALQAKVVQQNSSRAGGAGYGNQDAEDDSQEVR